MTLRDPALVKGNDIVLESMPRCARLFLPTLPGKVRARLLDGRITLERCPMTVPSASASNLSKRALRLFHISEAEKKDADRVLID